MRETTIARVYAETLLQVAQEHGAAERIATEAEALAELFREAPFLRSFLDSPRVAADEKRAVLRRALEGRVAPELVRFLEVVVERERQDLLDAILREFAGLMEQLRNQQELMVVSAVPLDDSLRERLRRTFEHATGRTIVLAERVDPALVGGMLVQIGDTRIDGSLRSRLENLRERMRGAAAAQRTDFSPSPR